MAKQLREAIRAGLIVAVLAGLIVFGVALILIGHSDHGLYLDLLGRTNANPDWKPWWGFWLLRGASAGIGLASGGVVSWVWYRKRSR